MTDVDRMVVWLRETMDAAQADAEAATPGPWHVTEYDWPTDFDAGIGTSPGEVDIVGHGYEGGGCERVQDARHIVRHQPAAELRRIVADRKILDLHQNVAGKCDECGRGYELSDWGPNFPCTTVCLLAEAWGWTEETT